MENMTADLEAEYGALLAESRRWRRLSPPQNLSMLDKKLSELQARALEQRRTRAAEHKRKAWKPTLFYLESQLEQSNWKLNRQVSKNLALREDIGRLQETQNSLCRNYQELNKELERQRQVSTELVEKEILASNQRAQKLRCDLIKEQQRSDRQQVSRAFETSEEQRQQRKMEKEDKQRAFMVLKLRSTAVCSEDQGFPHENLELLTAADGESDAQTRHTPLRDKDFLYIHQLNAKINSANERIKELQELNKRHEDQCIRRKDTEVKLEELRSLAASEQRLYLAAEKLLDQQKGSLKDLFTRTECYPATIADDNVAEFIGMLEELVLGLCARRRVQDVQPAAGPDDHGALVDLRASCPITLPPLPPRPPATPCPRGRAPRRARQQKSELLMDLPGLRQHVLPPIAEPEQCNSPTHSAGQKRKTKKKIMWHSSVSS